MHVTVAMTVAHTGYDSTYFYNLSVWQFIRYDQRHSNLVSLKLGGSMLVIEESKRTSLKERIQERVYLPRPYKASTKERKRTARRTETEERGR